MNNSGNNGNKAKRLLILCTTTGYQTRAFVEAAEKLGLRVVFGTDRCHVLEDPWQDGGLALRFEDPENSARQIVDYARATRIDAIVSLGDCPTPTAARASRALRLPHHSPEAADICRDKYLSRERLRAAGLNVPSFMRFSLDSDPREVLGRCDDTLKFPCVLKPLALSASRGVIRADTGEEFINAFAQIKALLRSPEVQVMRQDTSQFIQVESYIDGVEIAVEGLVDRGRLQVLAIFDKPDPLTGPYFEESIYVTPSRLKAETQTAVIETLERAALALGLFHGPLHAELRLNSGGVWILEVAARSIGGLCSRALRFASPELGNSISLEELIIRLAMGHEIRAVRREDAASGVMMIPIPQAGIFEQAEGVEEALETPGVDEIRITAKPNQKLVPLPEGSSYLGFIFARGATSEFVESALRQAHRKLRFVIHSALPVI
ncbi:MAG: ATP-grasp domain-containing protein [Terriglobia bacterium]